MKATVAEVGRYGVNEMGVWKGTAPKEKTIAWLRQLNAELPAVLPAYDKELSYNAKCIVA